MVSLPDVVQVAIYCVRETPEQFYLNPVDLNIVEIVNIVQPAYLGGIIRSKDMVQVVIDVMQIVCIP